MFDVESILIHERKGERYSSSVVPSKTEVELGWKADIKLEDYINNFKKFKKV